MTASEIAETLANGNITLAQEAIIYDVGLHARDRVETAILAIDVQRELAHMAPPGCRASDRPEWAWTVLRRCLDS